MKYYLSFLSLSLILISCTNNQVDLIVHNGVVYTVNETFDTATAFVVKEGKFLEIGNEDLLSKYNSKNILDLKGLTVYPGLIDAHCHFYNLGITQTQVELRGSESEKAMVDRVIKFAENEEGPAILGRGWDQNLWEVKEFPTKDMLDNAFPDKMVALRRVDGHALLVNQKVLDAAGITSNTSIEGGEVIVKDGLPTGVLIDNAMGLANAVIPKPSRSKEIEALKAAEKIAFENGLTTVDEAGLDWDKLELIDSLQQANQLKIRLYGMISNSPENIAHYLEKGITQTNRLTVRSVKVYADGALGSRGAALKAPYSDEQGNTGLFLTPINEINTLAIKLSANGFQMNTHAIGDAANEAVLKAYASALKKVDDPRWRVEHAQVVAKEDLSYFGKKVIPSVQPTHATSDMEWADERLGEERVKTAYTFKELLDVSGKLALGTDFPVEEVNPLNTFYAAVARKDKNGHPASGYQMKNALTREDALKGMTIWAAFANFEENQKGSIEVGKVADFVIMSQDIMTVDENAILQTEVVATLVDGQIVYQK